MHLLGAFLGSALLCPLTFVNGQNSDGLFFQPGATITRFQSTIIVPAFPTGGGVHAIWPGLENESGSFVYQNVLSDANEAGHWQFWIEYCCPNVDYTAITVYPGDSITSTFTLDKATNVWTDTWTLTPGATGAAAGQEAKTGTLTSEFASEGTLNQAVFGVELDNGAAWDFGQVQWLNLAIIAETTSTSWCTSGYSSTSTNGQFQYTTSGGDASTSGSSVTCSFGSIVVNS